MTDMRTDYDPDCRRCDVDRHICPGCGDSLTHSQQTCAACVVTYQLKTDEQTITDFPDPRPSDPLEALSWLGETEEEVVAALRERGIKGIRKQADACPLANYLANWWITPSIYEAISVTDDETDYYFCGDTPTPHRSFIYHFDSGAYPDLIAD